MHKIVRNFGSIIKHYEDDLDHPEDELDTAIGGQSNKVDLHVLTDNDADVKQR